MPKRLTPLIINNIYHIFNKSIDGHIVFNNISEYNRALRCFYYYSFDKTVIKFSTFLDLPDSDQETAFRKLKENGDKLVTFLTYCLMPTHYHFQLLQNKENGISKFAANFQNSYTKYFNTKYKRLGPIFIPTFKAVNMESEEVLLHVNRYIHLNPYSSGLTNSPEDNESYPWSSLGEYLNPKHNMFKICDTKIVLEHFKKLGRYKDFINNQAGYQRSLKKIRNQLLGH